MATSTTDLAVTPDQYSPVLNQNGEYADSLPYGSTNSHWYCPCSNTHAFKRSSLMAHFRSKKHQRWLSNMNANRHNHLTQFIEAQTTIKSQTRIIAEQQRLVDRAESKAAGLEHHHERGMREFESWSRSFICSLAQSGGTGSHLNPR